MTKLKQFLPDLPTSSFYHEPFLGAGSVFFAMQPKNAYLSDLNPQLIECYVEVQKRTKDVFYALERLGVVCDDMKYRHIRSRFNVAPPGPERAALFIFLNRTCFNGVYRVNLRGEFNVPYGKKDAPLLPSLDDLEAISKILASASISHSDFSVVSTRAKSSDFVYLDPPYLPLSKTAFFRHYTGDRFLLQDHCRLAELCKTLHSRDCKFLMSTSDSLEVRALLGEFELIELDVRRWVSGNNERLTARELLVRNY